MLIKEQELLKLIEEETIKALQESLLIEQARWKIPDDNKYEYSLTSDGKGYIAYENGKALGTFTDEAGLKRVKDAAPASATGSGFLSSLSDFFSTGKSDEKPPTKQDWSRESDPNGPIHQLQKALGVKADGAFGPNSRRAWATKTNDSPLPPTPNEALKQLSGDEGGGFLGGIKKAASDWWNQEEEASEEEPTAGGMEPSFIQKIKDTVYSMGMPLHVRAFGGYLLGRTRTLTYTDLTTSEYNTLKQIIVFSLTREGRASSRRDPESPGYLVNYSVVRGLLDKQGKDWTAIYTGEEERGGKTGLVGGLELADQISKTLGTASAKDISIEKLQSAMRSNKPISFKLFDTYNFNDKVKLAGGMERFFADIGKSWDLLKKGSYYEAIRKLAAWRHATGYKGYPVLIAITLDEEDYKNIA